MKTFSNLRTLSRKGVDKQKYKCSRINFVFFVIITKKVQYLLLRLYCCNDIDCFMKYYGK